VSEAKPKQALPLVLGVDPCVRCGAAHGALEWRKFAHPIEFEASPRARFDFWTSCPNTGDPILLCVAAG